MMLMSVFTTMSRVLLVIVGIVVVMMLVVTRLVQ
jgi:hypothetical protein